MDGVNILYVVSECLLPHADMKDMLMENHLLYVACALKIMMFIKQLWIQIILFVKIISNINEKRMESKELNYVPIKQ